MAQTISPDRRRKVLLARFLKEVQKSGNVSPIFDQVVARVPQQKLSRALLNSENTHVQEILCNALRKKGDRAAIPTLLRLAVETRNAKVRASSLEALGDLRARQAAPVLLRFLRDRTQPIAVRNTAVFSLGLTGPRETARDLIPLLAARHYSLRLCSAKALGFLRATEALPSLSRQWIREQHPSVKAALKEAMLKMLSCSRQ